MSATGLFSGLYTRVREYAELLDDVIIQVKSKEGGPGDPRRQKLAKLLIAIDAEPAADLAAQLLAVLIREQREGVTGWAEVGRALLSPDVPASVVPRLEELARAVENERARMLAKLRGRGS
jgi:hypothetical protein